MTVCKMSYADKSQVGQQHRLEPIYFYYFLLNLSEEQVDTYSQRSELMRGARIWKLN